MVQCWQEALDLLRGHFDTRIAVPSCGEWIVRPEGDHLALGLELDAEALDANIQSDGSASPAFLWVVAWWLEHLQQVPVRARLRVKSARPVNPALRRSAYLLHEYRTLFGEAFAVQADDPALHWEWPKKPVFNVEVEDRSKLPDARPGSEAWFECRLCESRDAVAGFNAQLPEEERIGGFHRQLPVGLFDGEVRGDAAHRWTPGGKSAVDAWALAGSKRVMHLFELKIEGNAKVGIIPEALYYATLLGHVRDGIGRFDDERSRGLRAVRDHKPRIVIWMVAPSFHPLVVGPGRDGSRVSPLGALNRALFSTRSIELRILPYEATDELELKGWNWGEAWWR